MARYLYATTPSDVTFTETGELNRNADVEIYDAQTGGSAVTDLLNSALAPVSVVTSDAYGFLSFWGPDNVFNTLWADGGVSGRVALFPIIASNAMQYIAAMSIDAIGDVQITAQTDGQTLIWSESSSKWVNGPADELVPTYVAPFAYWDAAEEEWPARPAVPEGYHVQWLSVLDEDAPPPPDAEPGDLWTRAPGATF